MNKNGPSDWEFKNISLSKETYSDAIKLGNGKNVLWATDINTELPIRKAETGVSSEMDPITFCQLFNKVQYVRGHASAMKIQRGKDEFTWSWIEYYQQCVQFSKAMEAVGVDPRKATNICGFNSPEWGIAFFGTILHNNVASGVYQTNTAEARVYQGQNSEAQIICVDTLEQLRVYHGILDQLPEVKAVVAWLVDKIPDDLASDKRLFTWKDFLEAGKSVDDKVTQAIMDEQRAGKCCCLIYTSGTTGNPKGVMLSHDNMIFNSTVLSEDMTRDQDNPDNIQPEDMRMISYLPLSHIAGLQSDLVGTMLAGSTLYFARPDALQGTLTESIKWAQPTLFFTVPRVWEKFEDALKAAGKAAPAFAQKLSGWAKGHAYKKVMDGTKGIEPGFMYKVANAIVLTKIKQALGLQSTRLFFYGAAPLKKSSVEYFASIDMPLMNMYGLSETTGSATTNSSNDFSLDHCGEMLSGTHIKITEQDADGKGEIRIAGRHIMMGYLKNEKATLEVIDEDGYFRTGDQGRFDGRFLKITGRIKELIITAGGENVAPVPIEDLFKAECPACSNVMVVGEQQRFMAALITFKVVVDMKTMLPTNELLEEVQVYFKDKLGLTLKTSDEACKNQKVIEHINECTKQLNLKLVSRAAHVKKFALIETDFSTLGGELTPTMKLKRKVTETKHQALVDKIYSVEAKL